MRLLLVTDSGEVLDSTDITREDWDNLSDLGAAMLVRDLQPGDAEKRPAPEVVEILEPGSTPELSDVPIFSGDPTEAWRTLTAGTYTGTGGLNMGTDAEYLEDVTLTVTDSSSRAVWGV